MSYCPKCGQKAFEEGQRFCEHCGAEIPPPEPDVSMADTGKLPAMGETPGVGLQPPPGVPPPTGPSGGGFPWQWAVIIALAGVILLAGAIGALLLVTRGDKDKAGHVTATATVETATVVQTVTKSATSSTQTTRTAVDSKTREYITSMDRLISQNSDLEQQIGYYADEINRVAPYGITDSLLASINTLLGQFISIKSEAGSLQTPTAFSAAHRDFLQLISYNIDRCSGLYNGASAWRAGAYYQSYFDTGAGAKQSYLSLYPVFQQEYDQARAAAQ